MKDAKASGDCPICKGRLWVCDNHPNKAFQDECECGAGMPCVCNQEGILGPGSVVLVDESGTVDGKAALALIDTLRAQLTEKDREIERLTMYRDLYNMAADGSVFEALSNRLSASQAREREAVEAHLRTIDQRDAAEDALSDAFRLVTGREPEWSNFFGYADAMEEITTALDQRETALAAARKALEVNRAAVRDACHATAIYGDPPPQMYLDALAEANAVLAGDNPNGADNNR